MGSYKSLTVLFLVLFSIKGRINSQTNQSDSLSNQKLFDVLDLGIDSNAFKRIIPDTLNPFMKNEDGVSLLDYAYYSESKEAFSFLFNKLKSTDYYHFNKKSDLISIAMASGDTSMVNFLCKNASASFDFKDKILIYDSFIRFCISYKIQNPARVGIDMEESYFKNAKDLDYAMADILYKYGFDFRAVNYLGQNILFPCRHLPEMSRFFIERNLDINHLDFSEKSFLEYFIDDLIKPLNGVSVDDSLDSGLEEYYESKFILLIYYIEKGAKVGKNGLNAWDYIKVSLKKRNNKSLSEFIQKNYPGKIGSN